MLNSDPMYLKMCECWNKYIADGRTICPPCNRVRKHIKYMASLQRRDDRRKAKRERRLSKRNNNVG